MLGKIAVLICCGIIAAASVYLGVQSLVVMIKDRRANLEDLLVCLVTIAVATTGLVITFSVCPLFRG